MSGTSKRSQKEMLSFHIMYTFKALINDDTRDYMKKTSELKSIEFILTAK